MCFIVQGLHSSDKYGGASSVPWWQGVARCVHACMRCLSHAIGGLLRPLLPVVCGCGGAACSCLLVGQLQQHDWFPSSVVANRGGREGGREGGRVGGWVLATCMACNVGVYCILFAVMLVLAAFHSRHPCALHQPQQLTRCGLANMALLQPQAMHVQRAPCKVVAKHHCKGLCQTVHSLLKPHHEPRQCVVSFELPRSG
jgi:hypothetical protein